MSHEPELQSRLDSLRAWSPRTDADGAWDDVRRHSMRKRRRTLVAVGAGLAGLALVVGFALAALAPSTSDDADVVTDSPTTALPDEVSPTTTAPPVDLGPFDHLESGWHELDTGPVPLVVDNSVRLEWTGTEVLFVAAGQVFGYEPVAEEWREYPVLPFGPSASASASVSVSVVSFDGALLAVATDPVLGVQSALLEAEAMVWTELGAVPNGYPADLGVETGPSAVDFGTSLVWTGERVIDATHGAVFDPSTQAWSPMPLPDDLVAFTQLLFANPVWDGNAFVLGYPSALPGLAYDADGSAFVEFDGIDASLVTAASIGPGFSVPFGDDVFFVSDAGLAATYSSRADAWALLPTVPNVEGFNSCPSNAATLGATVVVAPCFDEQPVYLAGGEWLSVDDHPSRPCCNGQWLGVEGALVVWDWTPDGPGVTPVPSARVWVAPRDAESASPTGSPELVLDPGWTPAPDGPLTDRTGASVVTVENRAYVIGGWDHLCPAAASCVLSAVPFSDGAVLDLATGEWSAIADAPQGFHNAAASVVGDDIYLLLQCELHSTCPTGPALLRYRTGDDAWDVLDPLPSTGYALTTFRDGLIAFAGSDERGEVPDFSFDPARDEWVELPDDPLPSVYDRQAIDYEGRLLVFGSSREGPVAWKVGASFDPNTGEWSLLPPSNTLGFQVWLADDRAFLNPHFTNAPGGVLDLEAMAWSLLPEAPTAESWRNDMAGLVGPAGATFEYSSGWVFDARSDVWVEVPMRPEVGDAYNEAIAATADGRLLVFGGERWSGSGGELLGDLWIWTPPEGG